MADGFVQLPPDSTGKKLRLVGPLVDGSYVEVVLLGDINGDQFPESPKYSTLTSANLAAGASVTLDAAAITNATTGRLIAASVAASVPLKAEVVTVVGGTPTTRDVMFTSDAELSRVWGAPHPNYLRVAGNGANLFRVRLTNLDNSEAADVYATLYWDEVT